MSLRGRGTRHSFVIVAALTTLCLGAFAGSVSAQDTLVTPIPDSPNHYTYSYDTYAELGWTEVEVTQHRGISGWSIDYTWDTLDDFMGTFYAWSPNGTQYVINFTEVSGTYHKITDEFNDEWADGTWIFMVEDVQGAGEQQALNITWTLEFVDADQPFDMVAETVADSAQLTWKGAADETGLLGYRIYRDGDPIEDVPVSPTTYLDEGLALGTYCYHATALYGTGESGPSNQECTTIYSLGIYGLPDSPEDWFRYHSYAELGWVGFEVIDQDRGLVEDWSITFTWHNINGFTDGSLHVLSPEGTAVQLGSGYAAGTYTVPSSAFNGEQAHGDWRVWMEDEDMYGDGHYRMTDVVVTIDVDRTVPTDLEAHRVGDDIELNWIAPANDTGLLEYNIYRDAPGGTPFDSVDSATTMYLDTAVAAGSMHCYWVSAVYSGSENQWPLKACAGAPGVFSIPDSPPPNQPHTYYQDSFAEAGWIEFDVPDRGAVIGWHISFDWTTNMPAEGRFYARSPMQSQDTILTGQPTGAYAIDLTEFDGEASHGTWRVWILDNDFFYDGMHQATDIVLHIDIDRTVPTDLEATTVGQSIVLDWIAPEEGAGLVGYNIYRDDSGGTPIDSVDSSTITYTDTDVAPGTTYCYHVAADYGATESQWPQPACSGTQGAYPIPDAPPMNHYGEPDNYWCNSYTESGWIDFEVGDAGTVADWYITFTWTTNWASEGRFYVLSPEGTQFTIINGDPSGTYEIDTDLFDGQQTEGIWRLWIQDVDWYCDASHRATDLTMYIIPAPPPPGDMDCDGLVTDSDIKGFVWALVDQDMYLATYPDCYIINGDFNGDLSVNGLDIAGFVAALTTGS